MGGGRGVYIPLPVLWLRRNWKKREGHKEKEKNQVNICSGMGGEERGKSVYTVRT